MDQPTSSCQNCGAALSGQYCAACGQRHLHDHDWALGHFLHELTHEILHVDSHIFRTLKLLLFRPGELTAEYLAGHRTAFISPIRLYLVVTAVFFLFGAAADFNVEGLTRVGVLKGAVEELHKLSTSTGKPYEVLVAEYNHLFHKAFSTLMALAVLVFGLALYGLFRARERWFTRHLIFALHCYSFTFAAVLFWRVGVHFLMTGGLITVEMARPAGDTLVGLCVFPYLLIALRRVYREAWRRLIWKWLALLFVQFVLYVVSLLGAVLIAAKLLA